MTACFLEIFTRFLSGRIAVDTGMSFSKPLDDCLLSRNLYTIPGSIVVDTGMYEFLETSGRQLAFSKSLQDFFLEELLWIQG